jgi:hypothetical protein
MTVFVIHEILELPEMVHSLRIAWDAGSKIFSTTIR